MRTLASCPLCGSERLTPYAREEPSPDRLHFAQARCEDCRLLVAQPQAEADEVAAYYGGAYYERPQMDPATLDEVTRRQVLRYELPILEGLGTGWPPVAGGEVFEVGAGVGTFLDLLRERGFRVSGCDLSPTAVEACRARDLDVVHGAFEALDLEAASFDAVVAMQVIEHVLDPAAFVHKMAERVRPGGVVVVGTEDGWTSEYAWHRLRARLRGRAPRYHTSTDHTFVFRGEHLRRLLEDAGCDAVRVRAYTCVPPRERLHWKLYKGLFRVIDRLLGHGELLLAVGRKA